ncbi:MAG: hypothetical protein ACFCD0_05465 [Gemmataceae bacterium]
MARRKGRGPSLRDLRDEADALERRQVEDDEYEDEDEEVDDDDDDDDEDDDEELDDEDEEEKPKKKKKKATKAAKPRAKRTRAVKATRRKVVWVVYDNSHKPVATFDYPQKAEAEAHAEELTAKSKNNMPFFVQPVKKEMAEEPPPAS